MGPDFSQTAAFESPPGYTQDMRWRMGCLAGIGCLILLISLVILGLALVPTPRDRDVVPFGPGDLMLPTPTAPSGVVHPVERYA